MKDNSEAPRQKPPAETGKPAGKPKKGGSIKPWPGYLRGWGPITKKVFDE
jgi:hypothetical protein